MKRSMGPPTKRNKALRLTPVPHASITPPPAPRSLIVVLRLRPWPAAPSHALTNSPRQVRSLRQLTAQRALLDTRDQASSPSSTPSSSSAPSSPKPNGDPGVEISSQGSHQTKIFSSSESELNTRNQASSSNPNRDLSTEISPEEPYQEPYQGETLSSSESTTAAPITTPRPASPPVIVPQCIILDNRRLAAARETVKILYRWGREEIIEELNGAIQAQNNVRGSVELEIIVKKAWVRESLRGRYRLYIQLYPEHQHQPARTANGTAVVKNGPGKECEFPGCGRAFVYGDYRVAFEPPEWSIPAKAPTRGTVEPDTNSCSSFSGPEEAIPVVPDEIEDPVVPVPDYHKLLTRGSIADYDRGEFYCPQCFEKLLDRNDVEIPAAGRPGKRKRASEKWLHPSPLCRIYSSVHAETRPSAGGRYELDYAAHELVKRWKDTLFDEGTRALRAKFGREIFKSEDTDEGVAVKEDGVKEEEQTKVQVDGGRGLAECLAILKGEQPKIPKGRKRTKY